jgi:hypothetical protein
MASRPVFLVNDEGAELVTTSEVTFTWHAGMSLAMRRKSACSLQEAAQVRFPKRQFLEVSRMSDDPLGMKLSAFNLLYPDEDRSARRPVECVFQSSKIFEQRGPFRDLLNAHPADAKRDERLRSSGQLIAFEFDGQRWPSKPLTAFYDWIYITALVSDAECSAAVLSYTGFTDIAFNPAKSFSCQAYAVALYVALHRRDLLSRALSSPDAFLDTLNSSVQPASIQPVQLPLL